MDFSQNSKVKFAETSSAEDIFNEKHATFPRQFKECQQTAAAK